MAVMTLIKNNNLKNLLKYINNNVRHDGKVLYYNGIGLDPEHAIRDMELCKRAYDKTGGTQVKHIVVSLEAGEENKLTDEEICTFADRTADIIYDNTGCQIAYAVHGNTDNLHIHYAVNSVQINNGKKIDIGRNSTIKMTAEINCLLEEYGLNTIGSRQFNESKK